MTSDSSNRRRFVRLELPTSAVAVDETGRELGRITGAGGGGISLQLNSESAALPFEPGLRMHITVLESPKSSTHSFNVEVRYRHGDTLGLEFL
jgi:hypothetical protein